MDNKFGERIANGNNEIKNQEGSLVNVERIHDNRGLIIKTKEEIKKYVEKPLVEACEMLWDKGIKTWESSANKEDFKKIGYAYIVIDYSSLSDENKMIADQSNDIGEAHDSEDLIKVIELKIPIESADMDQEKIEQKAIALASRFHSQPAFWLPKFSLEDLKARYGYEPEEEVDPEIFTKEEGFYYDTKEKSFYFSEDHYKLFNQNRE